jgi:glycosyltransferase involved in cell wall biosynthesis
LKLSILMPVYNEAATVGIVVKRVLDIEVVIAKDGSIDNASEILASIGDPRVVITEHSVNRGEGRQCGPRRPWPPATICSSSIAT